MSNLRLCPINFFDSAALVESPALESTMPATNAQLTARDKTARSTSSATQTIKGAWGGEARKINAFFLFRHNAQGGTVQLKLYPNDDYTGTAYDSTALAVGAAITTDSHDWGIAATAPDSAVDLLLADAPYFLFFSTFTAKSFEIIFASCDRSYWDVGRVFLGKYLEAPYNPEGMAVTPANGDQQTRTKGGSLRSRVGERWRDLRLDMFYVDDDTRALWRDLITYIQQSGDVAISVYPGATGRQERDHVFNMVLKEPSAFASSLEAFTGATYTFTEV